VFGEPARAISRNVVVIAVGFLPLLLAPLVPYKTVGMFMAGILAVSGMGTLLILPALLRVLERRLFAPKQVMGVKCNCAACLASATAAVLLVAVNLHQYLAVRWTTLTWISIVAIPLLAFGCGLMSRREKCRLVEQAEEKSQEENENEQA